MSRDLSVTVNNKQFEVPNTVQTVSEFLEKTGFGGREYELYRVEPGENIGPLGEMLVFDEGDEFVAVPKYVTNA